MATSRKRSLSDLNLTATGNAPAPAYEQIRSERIKSNMERMKQLGILDLTYVVKSSFSNSARIKHDRAQKSGKSDDPSSDLQPMRSATIRNPSVSSPIPPRRSSRLKNVVPIRYHENEAENIKESLDNNRSDLIGGRREEVYTEAHEKLLGSCETSWTLFVDGCDKSGKRIYDPVKGKTCHQCRQKTLGHHTSCAKCSILQGHFCGDCLYMRYGENILEVEKDPNWICPVCRGICNCSFCRIKKGWAPTGALYRKVSRLGFKSVAHYLILTRRGCSEEGSIKSSSLEQQIVVSNGDEEKKATAVVKSEPAS